MFDLRGNARDVKHMCRRKAFVLFHHPEIKTLQVTAQRTEHKNLFLGLEVMLLFIKVWLDLGKKKVNV